MVDGYGSRIKRESEELRMDGAWHFPVCDHNGIKRAQSPSRKARGDRDFKATPKEWSEERYPATQRQLYIVAYVDSTGAVSAEYAYDPFGKVVSHTGMDFDFQFSTKFYDPDIGMYYYGYRYYSPELRRWASRDPIGEEGGLNLYGFCGNDGVNGVDALGLWFSSFPYNDHKKFAELALTTYFFNHKINCPSNKQANHAKEKIIKKIVRANLATDHGTYYKNLAYHFNRSIGEDRLNARLKYLGTQLKELMSFVSSLSKKYQDGNVSDCDNALKNIGHLMHMWQDYFAHGIDPQSSDGVGGVSGNPLTPLLDPSSYGGFINGGSHGGLGTATGRMVSFRGVTAEPGDRAIDKKYRMILSERWSEYLLEIMMSVWNEACGCDYCQ